MQILIASWASALPCVCGGRHSGQALVHDLHDGRTASIAACAGARSTWGHGLCRGVRHAPLRTHLISNALLPLQRRPASDAWQQALPDPFPQSSKPALTSYDCMCKVCLQWPRARSVSCHALSTPSWTPCPASSTDTRCRSGAPQPLCSMLHMSAERASAAMPLFPQCLAHERRSLCVSSMVNIVLANSCIITCSGTCTGAT